MKNTSVIFILMLCFTGCVSEFNASLPSDNENILIISGDIIANSISEFKLSKSFSLDEEDPPEGYNNVMAEIVVIGSDGSKSEQAEYVGEGVHRIELAGLNPEVEYSIEVEFDGEVYKSTPSRPFVTPPIDNISWRQASTNGNISFHVSTHDEINTDKQFYLWNIEEDWEITSEYRAVLFYDPDYLKYYGDHSTPYYYCWRNSKGAGEILVGGTQELMENRIENKYLFEYESSDDRFSVLYSVLVKQQAISKAAYEYYSAKAKQNQDMGGLFTPQPAEILGNIYCSTNTGKKIFGYVNVVNNKTEERIFVDNNEITRVPSKQFCNEIALDAVQEILDANQWTLGDFYYSGYRPIGYVEPLGIVVEFWTPTRCADCRGRDGSKDKPHFWPNDHQ